MTTRLVQPIPLPPDNSIPHDTLPTPLQEPTALAVVLREAGVDLDELKAVLR